MTEAEKWEAAKQAIEAIAKSLQTWFETQEFGDCHLSRAVLVGLVGAIARGEIKNVGLVS